MSHKVLPTYPSLKHNTFFYKSPEIRFKQLISHSLIKPARRRIIIQNDPWRSIKEAEVSRLIERLDDRPQDLYEVIKNRNRKKNKFILLNTEENKENRKVLEAIEAKKRYYESQFRTLLRNRKSEAINILLPKLGTVRYLFKDKLHELKPEERKEDSVQIQ